jgi:hypothetical protein
LVEMIVLADNLRKSIEVWMVAKFPGLRP